MATLELSKAVLEKFHHWKEFLKRSKKYSFINDLLCKRQRTHPITDPLVFSWCPADEYLRKPYYDWMWSALSDEEKEELREDATYSTILDLTYPLFQNIHAPDATDLLEHRVKLFYELHEHQPVSGAHTNLKDTINDLLQHHDDDKTADMHWFKDELSWEILVANGEGKLDHLVCVDPSLPIEYLVTHFKEHIKHLKQRQKKLQEIREKQMKLQQMKSVEVTKRTLFFSGPGPRQSRMKDLIILLDKLIENDALEDKKAQRMCLEALFKEAHPQATKINKSIDSNWKKLRKHQKTTIALLQKAEDASFPGHYTARGKDKVLKTNELAKIQGLIDKKRNEKAIKIQQDRLKTFTLDDFTYVSQNKKKHGN